MNADKIVLSIDTSSKKRATELVKLSKENGGKVVKFGLEFASTYSWSECARIASEYSIDWIADAKLDDISHTVEMAVKNICNLTPRPIGITVHIRAGDESLKVAQEVAGETIIFGVTELTSIKDAESWEKYELHRTALVNRLMYFAKRAEIKGVVVSGQEIKDAQNYGFKTLVPGIRSLSSKKHDQSNTITPRAAIDKGADYIVIGRQITESLNKDSAYQQVLMEMKV